MNQEWLKHKGYALDDFKAPEFNCEKYILDLQALDKWEETVRNKKYPETKGFFFGSPCDDLEAINLAKEAIKEGYVIFYDSW